MLKNDCFYADALLNANLHTFLENNFVIPDVVKCILLFEALLGLNVAP